MLKELDPVVLKRDLPESRLREGDIGTVVHVHGADAYEVEFVTAEGRTVAVLTLPGSVLRKPDNQEMLHVRRIRSA